MEIAFGIICVVFFLIVVLGPLLRRWLSPIIQRWIMGKVEDRMRRMAGFPTRKEEQKARKHSQKRPERRSRSTVSMLQNVAEDVEYTEIRSFSSEELPGSHRSPTSYKTEQQIEDADYTEL